MKVNDDEHDEGPIRDHTNKMVDVVHKEGEIVYTQILELLHLVEDC